MAKLFWYFLFYSFVGFVLELVFARITRAVKQDRKCMYLLPLCPVYGLGALLIIGLPAGIRQHPFLLFLFGAMAATAAEYFMDWFYEKALKVRFWNYSSMPLNVNGRVCLPFSFAWGFLSLCLLTWLHPVVIRWARAVPEGLTLPAALVFLLDAFFTALLLRITKDTASLRWYDRFRGTLRERS